MSSLLGANWIESRQRVLGRANGNKERTEGQTRFRSSPDGLYVDIGKAVERNVLP